MVSPPSNNQRNMVQPSFIIPSNPDNLISYRERNNRIGSYNRNHDNVTIPNPNINNNVVDLNLLIYTTTETGEPHRIWRFEDTVVLPQNGALPIHLR
jgi:hypothetical protein